MERFSVIIVCLLAGQSECQAGDKGNQTQITELTHEDLADTLVDKAAIQNLNHGLETPTNSTASHPSCEPPIYAVLKELGALQERLAATVRTLEETNKKLEASEKKLSALNSTMTELSTVNQGNKIYYTQQWLCRAIVCHASRLL